MTDERTWPRIRDVRHEDRAWRNGLGHPEVDVTWAEGEQPQRFCGDNWCSGKCGLPALIIPSPAVEGVSADRWSKASGSQVACGPVMQSKRVEWTGERVLVPEHLREWFERRLWW